MSLQSMRILETVRPIDRRALTIKASFGALRPEQSNALAIRLVEWIQSNFEDEFLIDWKGIGHGTADSVRKALDAFHSLNTLSFFSAQGVARSNTIRSISALARKRRSRPSVCADAFPISSDVLLQTPLFTVEYLPPQEWKQRFLQIFQAKRRDCLEAPGADYGDLQCAFSCVPDRVSVARFRFSVYYDCIRSCLDKYVAIFRNLCSALANEYDTNITLSLQPDTTNEAVLMGKSYPQTVYEANMSEFLSDGFCNHTLWYAARFLLGVECLNWVGAATRRMAGVKPAEALRSETVDAQELSGGGIYLGVKKPLLEVEASDFYPIKVALYDAILPSEISYPIAHFAKIPLRKSWALLPILQEEIEICGYQVVFRHRTKCIDQDAKKGE